MVKYSLHKTLANQIKEKLLDYVHIDSGTKFFLLTDQRVMVVDPDAVVPLSIPLHRMCHALCSVVHPSPGVVHTCRFVLHRVCVCVCLSLSLSLSLSIRWFAEVSSSSKGSNGTTLDIVYEDGTKKTKKLSVVRSRLLLARELLCVIESPSRVQELARKQGDHADAADRKKTDQLAMTVLISSADAKRRFMERGR